MTAQPSSSCHNRQGWVYAYSLTMPMASMANSTVPKNSGMLLTVPTGARPSNEGASRKM